MSADAIALARKLPLAERSLTLLARAMAPERQEDPGGDP
jgi:hypothetical protein